MYYIQLNIMWKFKGAENIHIPSLFLNFNHCWTCKFNELNFRSGSATFPRKGLFVVVVLVF